MSANYWSNEQAASDLAEALHNMRKLDGEYRKYQYETPPSLQDEIKREGNRVRDAIRYLCSDDADDA